MGAVFSEAMTIRLEGADMRRLEAIATRLRMPSGAVARLLVCLGLEAVARDPSVMLGEARSDVTRTA